MDNENSNYDGIEDYDAVALGRVVRRARLDARLTQEALAEVCGIHPTYVGLIERGRTKPTLEKLWVIAIHVGLRPSELVAMAEDEAALPR